MTHLSICAKSEIGQKLDQCHSGRLLPYTFRGANAGKQDSALSQPALLQHM